MVFQRQHLQILAAPPNQAAGRASFGQHLLFAHGSQLIGCRVVSQCTVDRFSEDISKRSHKKQTYK
jgi:hypothetical protein